MGFVGYIPGSAKKAIAEFVNTSLDAAARECLSNSGGVELNQREIEDRIQAFSETQNAKEKKRQRDLKRAEADGSRSESDSEEDKLLGASPSSKVSTKSKKSRKRHEKSSDSDEDFKLSSDDDEGSFLDISKQTSTKRIANRTKRHKKIVGKLKKSPKSYKLVKIVLRSCQTS